MSSPAPPPAALTPGAGKRRTSRDVAQGLPPSLTGPWCATPGHIWRTPALSQRYVSASHLGWAMGSPGHCLQPRAFGLAEGDWLSLAGVPADRDDARLGHDLVRRRDDRFTGGEAGRAQALHLDADRHPPVRVADLRPQINFKPDDHIDRVAGEGLREEGVPALLEVGQEHRVIDVTQGVHVTPPDVDLMLEHRAHSDDRLPASWRASPRSRRAGRSRW